jgi:hypothetical protein
VYTEVYSFWQKDFGKISFLALSKVWEKLLENIEFQNFWKDAEDMYSEKFRGKVPMLNQEEKTILDQYLVYQAFRISGHKLSSDVSKSRNQHLTVKVPFLLKKTTTTWPGN